MTIRVLFIVSLIIGLISQPNLAISEFICSENQKPIKLGVVLALTGSAASIGESVKNALELSVTDYNSKSSYCFLPLIQDSAGDPAKAVMAVQKLVSVDKVKMILGPIRSNEVLAVAPITEAAHVILFTTVASAAEISKAGDFVFRNRETGIVQGRVMAEFLALRKLKKVALLVADSANSITYETALKELLPQHQIAVSSDLRYLPESRDFRIEILKAKESGAQAFYISPALGTDAALLIKQIRELGYNGLISGSSPFNTAEFFVGAGAFADGVYITYPRIEEKSSAYQKFLADYRQAFGGTVSDAFAPNSYDAVQILGKAVNACLGDNSFCVRDFLYKVKHYPGLGGDTSFDQNGDVIKPVDIYVAKDGRFVRYQPDSIGD